jgi:cytochrome c553
VEYGRYLASDVAGCINCHTRVDMKTGTFAAPIFSGGAELPSHSVPGQVFVSPNLTPHRDDGWLEGWSEDAFVARLRGGRVHEGSPMPWGPYRRLSEDDARAIYRFLRALPPAAGGPSPKARQVLLQAEL